MKGSNILGFKYSALANKIMQAFNPKTRKLLEGAFNVATQEEIDEALQLAAKAFQHYKHTSGKAKARFLHTIADEIMALGDPLVQRAMAESGLPEGRIIGERGRTVNQLRLFAKLVAEGSWVQASIDTAIPDRQPVPKADIRKMLVPIGPVVVFTASNFPLAFSTAGGDTASALASGCPVVVKAHESHLGTNALVALAIQRAAEATGMPDGVFSSLNGSGPELGQALAKHPLTTAIAFTGSFKAGKALFDTAAQRETPIPVFAEMGSINPVFILESALKNRSEEIAKQYAGSISLGVGQFCTNPGLIIGPQSPAMDQFVDYLGAEIRQITPSTMLNENVCNNYIRGRHAIMEEEGVELVAEAEKNSSGWEGQSAVATVKGSDFLRSPNLQEEIFGPFSLVVQCASPSEMIRVIQSLNGQLTGTIMGDPSELTQYKDAISLLQDRVGRLIFNGVPTGVEVCHSMQHGGPFPATTDSRFTSVGTGAIKRFGRPVAWQSWVDELLPDELKDDNPLGIWRTLNGSWSKEKA